jgi:hypothetical protein
MRNLKSTSKTTSQGAPPKTTKSKLFQRDCWDKITKPTGTRFSYVTPNKNPPKKHPQNFTMIFPRKNLKKSSKREKRRETKGHKMNHAESSIHTMKVQTRSSKSPEHPTLSQDES